MEERSPFARAAVPSISPVQFEEIDATLQQLRDLRRRFDEAEHRFKHMDEQIAGLDKKTSDLRQTCVEVAKSAHLSVQLAEDLFGSHAAAIDRKIADWSNKIHGAVLRSAEDVAQRVGATLEAQHGGAAATAPWALEGIAELHQSLRRDAPNTADVASPADISAGTAHALQRPAGLGTLPPSLSRLPDPRVTDPLPQSGSGSAGLFEGNSWQIATVIVVLAAMALAFYSWRLRDRLGTLEARARAADVRLVLAERTAGDARQESERQMQASFEQIRAAEQRALRAQAVSEVLAAPDLVRFDLKGTALARQAYAQVLWSRSRGLVLSASRLPALPPARAFQVWVLSSGTPSSAGVFAADQNGRGGIVISNALTFPKPVALSITAEAKEGSTLPSGRVYLTTEQ
jgi:hypothetical protein